MDIDLEIEEQKKKLAELEQRKANLLEQDIRGRFAEYRDLTTNLIEILEILKDLDKQIAGKIRSVSRELQTELHSEFGDSLNELFSKVNETLNGLSFRSWPAGGPTGGIIGGLLAVKSQSIWTPGDDSDA
jgi:hypothetical protein